MSRFVVGNDRSQSTLFPERLDDYLGEDNPVRAIDVFVDELDLLAQTSTRNQNLSDTSTLEAPLTDLFLVHTKGSALSL